MSLILYQGFEEDSDCWRWGKSPPPTFSSNTSFYRGGERGSNPPKASEGREGTTAAGPVSCTLGWVQELSQLPIPPRGDLEDIGFETGGASKSGSSNYAQSQLSIEKRRVAFNL